MTNEELRWLHRIEARIEIEGLEAGRRILEAFGQIWPLHRSTSTNVGQCTPANSGVQRRRSDEPRNGFNQ